MELERYLKSPLLLAGCAVIVILLGLALVNSYIKTDEAWLGQQVQSLAERGVIYSDFFRDFPPLDGEIVVYHKLLIWSGYLSTKLLGWGITQLRAVAAIAGLLLLALLALARTAEPDRRVRIVAVALLLLTPLFWRNLVMFRPEMLVALCGFASFIALDVALRNRASTFVIIAGIMAGLAGLAHPYGLMFAFAGAVLLLTEKRFSMLLVFIVAATAAFAPYLSGYFTHRDAFLAQTFENAMMTPQFDRPWYQVLSNLVDEHKRIFRKPEIIGLTVMTALSVIVHGRALWRQQRRLIIYIVAAAVVLAISPLPKLTRYFTPLAPLCTLLVARALVDATTVYLAKWRRYVLAGWLAVMTVYGVAALVNDAFLDRNRMAANNQSLSSQIPRGSVVMAPFYFIFHPDRDLVVQSWWGCERAGAQPRTPAFLDEYARRWGVEYLLIDPETMENWKLSPGSIRSGFGEFRLVSELPQDSLYLMSRE